MNIELTEKLVESVIPNVVISVDEETPLSVRLAPYADDAVRWLERNLLGDVDLIEEHRKIAERIITMRAFVMAIPALDLVATPSGFGVISSQNMAPASKERVERLIGTLSESIEELLCQLQSKCLGYAEWRESAVGARYCACFLNRLSDVAKFPALKGDIFARYDTMSEMARTFDSILARKYIGEELFFKIFNDYYSEKDVDKLVLSRLRLSEEKFVTRRLQSPNCPDFHEVWHYARDIIHALRRMPELWQMYLEFKKGPMENPKRQGGYFF